MMYFHANADHVLTSDITEATNGGISDSCRSY